MNVVIYEVYLFKNEFLFGALRVNKDQITEFATWSRQDVACFFKDNKDALWVTHDMNKNRRALEGIILDCNLSTIMSGTNAYLPKIDIACYDTMLDDTFLLDYTKCVAGKRIFGKDHYSNIDASNKKMYEANIADDLNQIYDLFCAQKDNFVLRTSMMQEFELPFKYMTATRTKIAAKTLGAKKIAGLEKEKEVREYGNLQIQNQSVLDFYKNEDYRKGKSLIVNLCGCEHTIAAGGIHAALKKAHVERALYFDVSGYYNLIMIKYDLLPRTMPAESKKLYEEMYYEQLRLKKTDPLKRSIYKVILLTVFGAMLNPYTDFYDPQRGVLVTITGELFLVDLLEKLEGLVRVIQSNTDGIIVEPLDWDRKDEVIRVVEEWEARTGFTVKKEEIKNLWQRDVNNYVFDNNGTPAVKGEALCAYDKIDQPLLKRAWDNKEASIISMAIVEYLLHGIPPERTVYEKMKDFELFQFVVKNLSFDYCRFESKSGNVVIPDASRAFASKNGGMIMKYKKTDKGMKASKYPSLPESVFVYNEDIGKMESKYFLFNNIDYEWYINRAKERIKEFRE